MPRLQKSIQTGPGTSLKTSVETSEIPEKIGDLTGNMRVSVTIWWWWWCDYDVMPKVAILVMDSLYILILFWTNGFFRTTFHFSTFYFSWAETGPHELTLASLSRYPCLSFTNAHFFWEHPTLLAVKVNPKGAHWHPKLGGWIQAGVVKSARICRNNVGCRVVY